VTRAAGGLTLRDLRADEREAAERLTLAAYGEYATVMGPAAWAGLERAVRAALADPGAAEHVVAERHDDGTLVGSVMIYPPAADVYGGETGPLPWPEVRLLAVAPTARGLGVGRALMNECVRRACAAGATSLGLHTSRSMRAALALYAAMGFVRAPEHDFLPDGGEVVEAFRLALTA
jgi:ribosomal protein S18 acetylase RimI-like enzyme